MRIIVKRRDLFLSLVRALAATEHPRVIDVACEIPAKIGDKLHDLLFMSKVYDRMQALDSDGTLSTIRQRLKQIELLRLKPTLPIKNLVPGDKKAE